MPDDIATHVRLLFTRRIPVPSQRNALEPPTLVPVVQAPDTLRVPGRASAQPLSRRHVLWLLGLGTVGTSWLEAACGSLPAPSVPTPTPQQGHLVRTLTGHSDWVFSVSWAPDSQRLVSGSKDLSFKVWEVASGTLLNTYRGPQAHTDAVTSVAWSFDGTRLATGSWDGTARVWEVATGKQIARYQHGELQGHQRPVLTVAWSHDPANRYLASAGSDHLVKVWDTQTATATPLQTYLDDPHNVHAVAWSPFDLTVLASATDDNKDYIHDITQATTQALLTYRGHHDQVNTLAWAPKASGKQTIASGSGNYDPGTSTKPTGDTTVQVWDATTGKTLRIYTGHHLTVVALDWSPDGIYLASGGAEHTIHVWEAATGRLIAVLEGHTDDVESIAWSPDGRLIASASFDQTIRIWAAPK